MDGTGRILRNSSAWFDEGSRLKAEARHARRCVECATGLENGRSPYCGRRCQWRFRGRYFWDAARTFVIHRDRFRCSLCGLRHRVAELEVDHIVEIALGGASLSYDNLQTVCRRCHQTKTSEFLHRRAAARRTRVELGRKSPEAPEEPASWFPA